jgi:hypothetical protein
MARLPDGRISKYDVHGYRVTVGRKADGKPRLFWLGKNEEPARYAAHCYREAWQQIQAVGIRHWTPELERRVKQTIDFGQRTIQQVFDEHTRRAQLIAPWVGWRIRPRQSHPVRRRALRGRSCSRQGIRVAAEGQAVGAANPCSSG